MSYGKRLGGWVLEMLAEAAVFTFVLFVMMADDDPITVRDIAVIMISVLWFLGLSGYLVTTLIVRLVLRGKWWHIYPFIALLLFLAHFEVMNISLREGMFEPHNRLIFRVIGSCAVFLVAGAISFALQRLERVRRARLVLQGLR